MDKQCQDSLNRTSEYFLGITGKDLQKRAEYVAREFFNDNDTIYALNKLKRGRLMRLLGNNIANFLQVACVYFCQEKGYDPLFQLWLPIIEQTRIYGNSLIDNIHRRYISWPEESRKSLGRDIAEIAWQEELKSRDIENNE